MEPYDKLNNMKCGNCAHGDGEYYLEEDNKAIPYCKDCLFEVFLHESGLAVREVQDLEDEDEDDIQTINELWANQYGGANDD